MSVLEIVLYIVIGLSVTWYVTRVIYDIILKKKNPEKWREKHAKKKKKKEEKEDE